MRVDILTLQHTGVQQTSFVNQEVTHSTSDQPFFHPESFCTKAVEKGIDKGWWWGRWIAHVRACMCVRANMRTCKPCNVAWSRICRDLASRVVGYHKLDIPVKLAPIPSNRPDAAYKTVVLLKFACFI